MHGPSPYLIQEMKKGRYIVAIPVNRGSNREKRSGAAFRYGLAVSGALALFAVLGALTFGGPF